MWTPNPLFRDREGWSHDTTARLWLLAFQQLTQIHHSKSASPASDRPSITAKHSLHPHSGMCADCLWHYLRCHPCALEGEVLSVPLIEFETGLHRGIWGWECTHTADVSQNGLSYQKAKMLVLHMLISLLMKIHVIPGDHLWGLATWFQGQVIHIFIQQTLECSVCARCWFSP